MILRPFFVCAFLFGCRPGGTEAAADDAAPFYLAKRSEGPDGPDDFQSCMDNFDIHTDKIIRTQDSRAMGAKYINEKDVVSREECLKLCCTTDNCDVFVFEEKSPGSCYLFECGSPEDFKCKFTHHRNYTSAVLNRHLTELESQIKFTQHEHELTKLREPSRTNNAVEMKVVTTTSTELPINKEMIQIIPSTSNDQQKNNACSRYQFSCHTSGECIAIYNACDGVPQCADGSDEAPELGCPVQASSTSQPKPAIVTMIPHVIVNNLKTIKMEVDPKGSEILSSGLQQQYQPNIETVQRQWPQQQPYIRQHSEMENVPMNSNSLLSNGQQSMNQDIVMQNARASYGREGEGMTYHNDQNWPYQYHANTGGSQIFTHKGNGLVQQAERYQQHQYIPPDTSGVNSQYNDQIPSDFTKYNYPDNVPYRMFPQNPQVNNWQSIHKPHALQGANILDESMTNRNPDREHINSVPQDYYYDDIYRNRGQLQVQRYQQVQQHNQNPALNNELLQQPVIPKPTQEQGVVNNSELGALKNNTSPHRNEMVVHPTQVSTTSKPNSIAHHGHVHSSHRKLEKLTAEVTLRETSFTDAEMDGHNSSPSGAILSLTFGLCITGIMVILVGCRMRMVHKRMRRGGKSPYAHDADFLVNGMYL